MQPPKSKLDLKKGPDIKHFAPHHQMLNFLTQGDVNVDLERA